MKPNLLFVSASALLIAFSAQTQAAVSLGTAANFGVLSADTITNTGLTTVIGNIGVQPGSAITGFFGTVENDGPGTFTGSSHQGDSTAMQAQADALQAYNDLQALPISTTLADPELGGLTLAPGVYVLGSAGLTGTLTLDGIGDYVFRIDTTLITAVSSMVNLINGAEAANVFWAVGTAVTLGNQTDFEGNIIASSDITLNTGAILDGRIISLNGAVTMISNTIVPEPSTTSMLSLLSLGLVFRRRRSVR